ncbi:hypothetical protein Ljor_2736 [Legionella jordanis]|uniref:Uncharacterized protein n=1 Tax=Legionella jordanis TaxID=456 RepID=A0A0W0VE71_9GAMM|nr:hypothetical protein Ljor_2736 [Legionella jordanis]
MAKYFHRLRCDKYAYFHKNCLTVLDALIKLRFSFRGYSSAGRALAWHARGRRFDPA